MAEKKFDPDQKRAVAVRRNAVVAAGAGSGKTTVLAARFLELVKEGARVPEILTLTFTRKAAAEMYARIHRLLSAESENPRIREELGQFDQASISTLDSFCARLAKNDAMRFGLPLSFSVDQEALKRAADELALDFLLRHHRRPALARLIAANGFETTWKEFFSAYGLRELYLTRNGGHTEEFRRQEERCRRKAEENLKRLDEIYSRIAACAVGTGATVASAAKAAEGWGDPLELLQQEKWEELILRCEAKPYRKPGSNTKDPNLLLLREHLEALLPLAEETVSYLAILKERETYAGLMELMDSYTEEWNRLKQRRGVVSFGDVVAMAVELLKEDPALRGFYKAQFSHIMIDEFQDNNEAQKELLYLLAEKRDSHAAGIPSPADLDREKLFFVGDEKQSIYRFRGADVSVFKRLSRELGDEAIELSTNYRSDPRLIDFFNRFFPRVMEPEAEQESDFEARFKRLNGRPRRGGPEAPLIELRLLDQDPDRQPDEPLEAIDSEAYEAARIIHSAVEEESFRIVQDGSPRRPRYSDFALLLRSTGNQIRYENMFRRFGIPYRTENIRTLFMEAPANDIYAALQLCVYPDDRLAYALFLRSLFVNLQDQELVRELSRGTPPFSADPADFPAPEAEKYRLGGELISELSSLIDRVPHREIIRYLWFDRGYRFNLLKDPAYHGYLEYYDYLCALADRSWRGGESMVLFLDFLRENLGDYKKLEEVEILTGENDGVRIMTIHKSKGLEFPVVLIGSTGQGSQKSGKRAPYFIDPEYGLTVNLALENGSGAGGKTKYNPFYEQGKALNELQELAELKRLLYVACTRAEQHLIMLGHRPRRSSGGIPSLLDLICRGLETDSETADSPYIRRFPARSREELVRLGRPKRPRSIAAYQARAERPRFPLPVQDSPLSVTRLNTLATELLPPEEDESRELPSLGIDRLIEGREVAFGTLVHRALELQISGSSPFEAEGIEGVSPAETEKLKHAAAELAHAFWESPSRRSLIPDGIKPVSEAPFTLALESGDGRRLVDGAIDLYADLGERLVCLDFKTNRRLRPGAYAMQMWLYRRALQELTGKPVDSYLIYLREPKPHKEEREFSPDELKLLLRRGELEIPAGE